MSDLNELTGYYRLLLDDLLGNRLKVCLVGNDPEHSWKGGDRLVRSVESRNPEWFRILCARYLKNRKKPRRRKAKFVDSSVSRKDVIRVLERLVAGKKCRSFLILDCKRPQGKYSETCP